MRRPRYNFREHPCIRIQDGQDFTGESHICFFCGVEIENVGDRESCEKCGLIKCDQCQYCLCDVPVPIARRAVWLHKNYCRNRENFFADGFPVGASKIAGPMMKCITHCRTLWERQHQKDTAYPFLQQIGAGWVPDFKNGEISYETFRFNLAQIIRYYVAIERIVKQFAGRKHLRILEIGPGWVDPLMALGQLHRVIPNLKIDVVDIDTARIRRDIEKVPYAVKLRLFECDLNRAEAYDVFRQHRAYDVITMFEVMEHLKPSRVIPLMRRLYNALKFKGLLFLSTPDPVFFPLENAPEDYHTGHRKHYSQHEVHEIVNGVGFDIIGKYGCLSAGGIPTTLGVVLSQQEYVVRHPEAAATLVFVASKERT
jgi:2-polyprenyl-3-methyl-5-hydroxy-6-metoxy-1,4-benzoquinol methylase